MTEKGMPKIVLTGGPGGGKTTALDLFRREFAHKVAVVPESATILFQGGVERDGEANVIKETQKTIFQLQQNLEKIALAACPNNAIICDRGTLDGLAYWPGGEQNFFNEVESDYQTELMKYDAVIFFETAAASNQSIASNNPVRTEDEKQALELDKRLQEIWSKHPHYHFVGSNESFLKKINFGILTIEHVLRKFMLE
jgi:thymidylate kinase